MSYKLLIIQILLPAVLKLSAFVFLSVNDRIGCINMLI